MFTLTFTRAAKFGTVGARLLQTTTAATPVPCRPYSIVSARVSSRHISAGVSQSLSAPFSCICIYSRLHAPVSTGVVGRRHFWKSLFGGKKPTEEEQTTIVNQTNDVSKTTPTTPETVTTATTSSTSSNSRIDPSFRALFTDPMMYAGLVAGLRATGKFNDPRLVGLTSRSGAVDEMLLGCKMFSGMIATQIVGETSRLAKSGAFAQFSPIIQAQFVDKDVIAELLSDSTIVRPILETLLKAIKEEQAIAKK